jgi:hypothetical protein
LIMFDDAKDIRWQRVEVREYLWRVIWIECGGDD